MHFENLLLQLYEFLSLSRHVFKQHGRFLKPFCVFLLLCCICCKRTKNKVGVWGKLESFQLCYSFQFSHLQSPPLFVCCFHTLVSNFMFVVQFSYLYKQKTKFRLEENFKLFDYALVAYVHISNLHLCSFIVSHFGFWFGVCWIVYIFVQGFGDA